MAQRPADRIRNIGIIAHVDHGKTTLVDELLKQSGTFRDNQNVPERAMDSMDQERERGITILAKNTAVTWNDWRINIVDTPGHADFGGEVERVLRLVDTTVLVVDASEGPMPQTKFVLRKSLALGHRPIVVINKVDRPDRRLNEVLDEIFDLFVTLEADEHQLDFPVIYASAKQGYAINQPEDEPRDLTPLFEMIVKHTPASGADPDGPLQLQVATLDYNEFLGRIAIGRIYRGRAERGQRLILVRRDGTQVPFRLTKLMGFQGLERVDRNSADAGDIVALAGVEDVTVGETICTEDAIEPMELIPIDEPTITMNFLVNNSPFAGTEGRYVTSRNLRDRLFRQLEHDVSLRVEEITPDCYQVSGRGLLHLSVLIESMRREGFELGVSQPQVITRLVDGELREPYEEVFMECDQEYAGTLIDRLNRRGAQMQDLTVTDRGTSRARFVVPARGLIGFRSEFLTESRGTGVIYTVFSHYGEFRGDMRRRSRGVLIAQENCETVTYGLFGLQERGYLCAGPGEKVYLGQIVGVHAKENDLVVNPAKKKQLTNMRASGSDDSMRLVPARRFTLEEALEFIEADELVEVTPASLRLRKRYLDHNVRRREEKSVKAS